MQFQNELDSATLDFDRSLHTDLHQLFLATQSKLVVVDGFTSGKLSQQLHNIIPSSSPFGSFSCSSMQHYSQLIGKPGTLPAIPSQEAASTSAKQISDHFSADIAISLFGLSGYKKENSVYSAKIFIGYSFNQQISNKVLECTGIHEEVMRQSIQATLGYLKLLFINYPLEKEKSNERK